jgi:hypothetical protein
MNVRANINQNLLRNSSGHLPRFLDEWRRVKDAWRVTDVALTNDTPTQAPERTHPDDPQQIGSGSASSPGGSEAPAESASDMTHGQEGYAGPRTGGETDKHPSPAAGDVDPSSTRSSEETGQDGDVDDPKKSVGHAWNG